MPYNTHGKLKTDLLCLFSAEDGHASSGLKPECAWRDADGVVRVGTWLGGWDKIERAWALDTYGNWLGSPPSLLQADALRVLHTSGAALVPAREGDDLVYHVDSGAAFKIDWLKLTVTSDVGTRDGNGAQYSIFDAADGELVRVGNSPAIPVSQTALPDGSYVVHVQYSGVVEGLRLPPGYVRNAIYNYTTEDERLSHFNPFEFVGEVPADPDHDLNVWRREILAQNLQQDNPAYAKYVTFEGAVSGEASALKLQVGGGTWACGAGVIPIPSRALCELDFETPDTLPEGESPSTPVPLAFDPLAHVVSQVLHTRHAGIWGGKVLLGGARLTESGPKPALWQWNADNTATLLGVAQSSCEPVCEQMLSTGLVTGLTELQDGSIVVLTLCSRHKYDAQASLKELALPRFPLAADGEPGGRAIVAQGEGIGTRVLHTTEALGKQPDPNTPSFYNVMVDVLGERIVYAPGTLAHVDGCLWRHRGKVFGVRCDGAPQDEATRAYITSYDGLWNRAASPWRVSWFLPQRGISVNGRNLAFGYIPETETARVVRDDGHKTQVLECDYRLRGAFLTYHTSAPYLGACLAPARKVLSSSELDAAWSLIELDGALVDDPEFPDEGFPEVDPPDTPDGETTFYRVLELPAQQPIYALQIRDMIDGAPLLAANADSEQSAIGVWLRVDSNADMDDFESYIWRPRLDRAFALPLAAQSKVEVLVISREELAPEQLPELAPCA